MRNARSKSTFRPRWRQRVTGKAGKRTALTKPVTSSASEETYDPEIITWVSKVNSAGSSASTKTIDALNTFLRTIKGQSDLSLLKSYEVERRPHAKEYISTAIKLGKMLGELNSNSKIREEWLEV